jgi:uncharacterized membrane protein
MTEDAKPDDLRKFCITLYALYGAGGLLLFQPSWIAVLAGLVILTVAYSRANSKKETAKETPYASHLRWMYRSFWIWVGVIQPVAVIILGILLYEEIDFMSLLPAAAQALQSGDEASVNTIMDAFINSNATKIYSIIAATAGPTFLWWIRRCWIGYAQAKEGKPVENVMSWL